jgi:hypothetical protein
MWPFSKKPKNKEEKQAQQPQSETNELKGIEEIDAYLSDNYEDYKAGSLIRDRIKHLLPKDFTLQPEILEENISETVNVAVRRPLERYLSDLNKNLDFTNSYPDENGHYEAVKDYDMFFIEGEKSYLKDCYLLLHLLDRQARSSPEKRDYYSKIREKVIEGLDKEFDLATKIDARLKDSPQEVRNSYVEEHSKRLYLNLYTPYTESQYPELDHIRAMDRRNTVNDLNHAGFTLQSRSNWDKQVNSQEEYEKFYDKYKSLFEADNENIKTILQELFKSADIDEFEFSILYYRDLSNKCAKTRLDSQGNILPYEETLIPALHHLLDVDLKHNAEQKEELREHIDNLKSKIKELELADLNQIKAEIDDPSLAAQREELEKAELQKNQALNYKLFNKYVTTHGRPISQRGNDSTLEESVRDTIFHDLYMMGEEKDYFDKYLGNLKTIEDLETVISNCEKEMIAFETKRNELAIKDGSGLRVKVQSQLIAYLDVFPETPAPLQLPEAPKVEEPVEETPAADSAKDEIPQMLDSHGNEMQVGDEVRLKSKNSGNINEAVILSFGEVGSTKNRRPAVTIKLKDGHVTSISLKEIQDPAYPDRFVSLSAVERAKTESPKKANAKAPSSEDKKTEKNETLPPPAEQPKEDKQEQNTKTNTTTAKKESSPEEKPKHFSLAKTGVMLGALGTAAFVGNNKEPQQQEANPEQPQKKQNWFQRNAKMFVKALLVLVALDMGQSMVRGTKSYTEQGIGKFTNMIKGERANATAELGNQRT